MYAIEVTFDGKHYHVLRECQNLEVMDVQMGSLGDMSLYDRARVRLIDRKSNIVLRCWPSAYMYDVVEPGLQKLGIERTGRNVFERCIHVARCDDMDCPMETECDIAAELKHIAMSNKRSNKRKRLESELRPRLLKWKKLSKTELEAKSSQSEKPELRRINKVTLWYLVRETLSYLETHAPDVRESLLEHLSPLRPEIDDALRVQLPRDEPTFSL